MGMAMRRDIAFKARGDAWSVRVPKKDPNMGPKTLSSEILLNPVDFWWVLDG